MRRGIKWAIAIVASPFIIFILLVIAIYLPPVQQWAVNYASSVASESMGMDISVEKVRMSFPLDISIQGIRAVRPSASAKGKTDKVALVEEVIVDVRLLPLLSGEVKIDEIELNNATINTLDIIPQATVKGTVGKLAISDGEPVATVNITNSMAQLEKAVLDNAHLDITLNDTTIEDTTESQNNWRIYVRELAVSRSDVQLHMYDDSLRVGLSLHDAHALRGDIDLGKSSYKVGRLQMKQCAVSYDTYDKYVADATAFDYNHIALEKLTLTIDSIACCGSDVSLAIKSLSMQEKSGLTLTDMKADIALDTTAVKVDGMMRMPGSVIAANVFLGWNALDTAQDTPSTAQESSANAQNTPSKTQDTPSKTDSIAAEIDASIDLHDLTPLLTDVKDELHKLMPLHLVSVKGEAHGNMSSMTIPSLTIEMPTAFVLEGSGSVNGLRYALDDLFSPSFAMALDVDAKTYDMSFVKRLMDKQTAATVNIPPINVKARLQARGADYDVQTQATEGNGSLQAAAKVNLRTMAYDVDAKTNSLNISHFVNDLGVGPLTAIARVSGQGTDALSPSTWADGAFDVTTVRYGQYDVNDVSGSVALRDGRGIANIDSRNDLLDGRIDLDALISTKKTDATVATELHTVDLYKLGVVDVPLRASFCSHLDLRTDYAANLLVQGNVGDITIVDSTTTYHPDDVMVDVLTTRDTTRAKIECGDFELQLNAQGGYQTLLNSSNNLMTTLDTHLRNRTIDQTQLRGVLPVMNATLTSSTENPVCRLMKYYGIGYDYINATVQTSPDNGIFADIDVHGLETQGYQLDTISLDIRSADNPMAITYTGRVTNVEPNEYVFDVMLDGELLEHGVSVNTAFYDAAGELGVKLGLEATMEDEGIMLHITPNRPVIAYETFTANDNNYILLAPNGQLKVDIDLFADNGTGIELYSLNNDNAASTLQDLTLSATNLDLNKLLSAIPYAPKVSGTMNGDVHFIQDNDSTFSISSSIDTRQLVYEDCPIGNLSAELVYMPKAGGEHYVDGILSLDEKEVGSINGSYNFDTQAINADLSFEQFPMQIANGFIPDQIIGFEGDMEGVLSIKGTTDKPDVNGELYPTNCYLISEPYSIRMRFDDDTVHIANSQLLFEDFHLYANNNQPLSANGAFDFSDTDHMKLNLLMRAENFLLIDSKETSRSEAYGTAYVNFFAALHGELDQLQMRGKVEVLPTTDLYYILRDSPLSTDNRMQDLVTFTNLHNDEVEVVQKPTIDGMDIRLDVDIKSGAHVKCWLNDDRTNYVDLLGEGSLNMRYTSDDIYLTGRYTITEGEMKYSLPVIPLKTFTISSGSYVEFTGDMMNPRLDITAKETRKASVDTDGTTRMVTFNTGVKISKTLNDMGLEFIIEAPEDNTVSDQLSMMSAEERGKLAVTMLTTGMYFSDGNTAAFSMNSALNSFLQSEISAIAGSALKSLDLNFGIDNSTEEDGTMHTNYSFKFAKRFWNNRLSISVGGKISTGPDVSGQNKSFFDNVEMQYRLSDVSNKYLRLFYNQSVYDYLEGYVGQYGAGYMWKKKIQTLKEIFYPSLGETRPGAPNGRDTRQNPADSTKVIMLVAPEENANEKSQDK